MCGIAGYLDADSGSWVSSSSPRERLNAMLLTLKHRGPDDWGVMFAGLSPGWKPDDGAHVVEHNSPSARLALGHRRLSILDLSEAGRQPMFSRDGTIAIVLNGEIYNYIELRDELAAEATFRTKTDTEVLIEAYRRWGVGMLGRLDGMFAFALWDAPRNTLICARDPFGIKPFYYSIFGRKFVFASEPRAVLAGLETRGQMDASRTAEFLVFGVSDHDEGTFYQEVRQLRGGHWIEVRGDGRISEPRVFWDPPEASEACVSQTDVPERVRQQIDRAVDRQLRSDVPVGGCLSGGIDSGSIIASVSRNLGSRAGQFRALTLSSDGFVGDESGLAALTAETVGVRWVRVEPELNDIAGDLESMVRAMGEPFSTLSMLGQYKLMERAGHEGLKVMLDGQGGDEVFLGYPRVAQRAIRDHLQHGRLTVAWREWLALKKNASISLTRSLVGNVFFSSPRLARFRNSVRVRRLVTPELIERARIAVAEDLFRNDNTTGVQVRELTRYVLPQLLRYEDRNSMAFGLEARVPMLSVDLVALAMRLPLRWKVRNGWTKFALRMAMRGRLPDAVLWNKRKRGFEVPQDRWSAAALPTVRGWLAELPANCPVNGAKIAELVGESRGNAHWLSRCLSVALWMRFSEVRV